ncbi:glucan biosynthesis protein G [Herbaspirillum sp. alder98]|uniref:glucan biosynthesis protein G n=1 Tax=Herbaspirillum sp. alder98 TaxID=2913096 RepID=UPI001CD88168|nr:glucan biosynthesis protein G [Herbaspirillum sp. alder98]MCA1324741.1 glucan biosynthesis protein G [Herbaspirillum sp. alder98]
MSSPTSPRLLIATAPSHPARSSWWRRLAVPVTLVGLLLVQPAAFAFDFNSVAARAKALAGKSYKKPSEDVPKAVRELSYEQSNQLRYRVDKSYWRAQKLPFELTFIHLGGGFNDPVKINEVIGNSVREIGFNPALFDYSNVRGVDPRSLRNIGFAGFRIRFPVNNSKVKDDVLTFHGASYFRAMGKGQGYGLSARGLAIDTALYSGEEFPRFTEFWLERPSAESRELVVYALLDSPRATGAYRFVLKPGSDTAIDVKAQIYLRSNVTKLGIAPLTSMFLFGENQPGPADDFRPEVHDSDGLSMQSGTGEWLWRPLVNPKRLLVTSFSFDNPLGFGLMQRDREFGNYQDLDYNYQSRPSAWIEPKGKWGSGRVELVQIPTPDETNDNIVAYWIPNTLPKPGQPLNVEYRMLWQKEGEKRPPLAWVTQTLYGHGYRPRQEGKQDDGLALSVDFDGSSLKKLAANARVEGVVEADANGKIASVTTRKNEVTGGWRIEVKLRRVEDNKPVELRGFLRNGNGGTTLSETWSYILPPN